MSAPIFDSSAVHHPARLPGWLALAFSAGAVNALAFAACERFVTHVTGTVTRLGIDAGATILVLEYLLVLAAFVLGAVTSVFVYDARVHRGIPGRGAVALGLTSLVLAAAGVLGHAGVFGAFGGSVEEASDFALLTVLAFAMGLQNASVATATGMLVRTTHMTGPATDLGISLGMLARGTTSPETREITRRSAILRAGKIASFATGALFGFHLAHALGFLGLLVPAVIIGAVAVLGFARVRERVLDPSGV